MNLKKTVYIGALASIAIVGCKDNTKEQEVVSITNGINVDLMDKTISPNEDFFQFINGTWLKNNIIPDDRTRWGSFDELRKMTDDDVLSIVNKAMNDVSIKENSDQAKALYLYKSILNTKQRDILGITPIKEVLTQIEAIDNISDLQAYLTAMEPKGSTAFFGTYIGADSKDSNKNVVYLGAGSVGLPDRDYYIKEDSDSKEKREKYVSHITKMLQYLGDSEELAAKSAKQILSFETKLAIPKMDKVERRDARNRYNPMAITDLQKMVPSINWKHYFTGLGIAKLDTVIVSQLKYTKALQEVFTENNISDWKAYLKWGVFNNSVGKLSEELEKANWEFYSKTLKGAKEQRPKTERALATVNGTVGEALGKLYVSEKFPPEAKAKAKRMITNVLKAFENRINNVAWMSEDTKLKAIEKLKATTVKIGYPDKWKDYSKLNIAKGNSYFENMQNVSEWRFKENINKLNEPVDKTEWHMSPQTVNAYFNPSYNEIVFPAAILQPPFYDYNADDAVNYGGIGAVIGHEISHSFDDSGARFDKNGNLNNWWTEEDAEKFKVLGKALADQYSEIEVLPETNINGEFTLGENIGDLGGVNVAYDALQLYYEKNGKPERIDGFTGEQRYFMSWATVWRSKYRDEALKNQIKTDPHSPGMVRASQPLKNVDAFYDAFNIKEGDSMYLAEDERVRIW
ncbi:MAG: M13 family metallopeptidase [Flavobacteriaceae bacterium]|nr:M13 family metallopeptidase [Flavobacteriaceae bacterium]